MNGREFIRNVKKLGKRNGVHVRFDPERGKGSHGQLHYGDRRTTVKNRRKEIRPGLLAEMLRQLGISREQWMQKDRANDIVHAVRWA